MLGTKPTIILSSDLAVKDLLDKKGNIYSDRPDMFVSQDIASGGHRLVIMVSPFSHKIPFRSLCLPGRPQVTATVEGYNGDLDKL